ncbi:16S rRNA (cytidine(1402)-2'-O)-methyltransferase [Paeniroseomonas aquatica]|uniref:Ribosomal RNA small subunit methyltransferase I n=1 Tax=Paeniroseomonas aquatica TaxID=373043 RepID=A0ABT8A2H4_9PROT|nr:16S rRNA (cytidine(1402)-2'-O)-methyltransferase [Paeniroseomonas aquatica]MDN3563957.1 16S rRNA (cytidine(1402)-2'-O)-methyltransferase [Paeniroseomonas aquatica]
MTELASDPPDPVPAGTLPAGMSTGLTLVATPIGNLGDLSPRALATLRSAAVVLCEDTRVTGAMLARHGVSVTMVPLHEHNEDDQTPRILDRLRAGERVALVSDAGTPLVSDPGYRLVRAAIAAGLPVGAIPGPNAAVMALTLSGLPPHPFLFLGFLPVKAGPRAAELARLRAVERAGLAASLIFYEAPHRLAETLAALAEAFGPERPAAVARELTKRFEEVRRGDLGSLAGYYGREAARGEIAIVVGPAPAETAGAAELDKSLRNALASGMSVRDAAAAVAAATGLPRKQVYALALRIGTER